MGVSLLTIQYSLGWLVSQPFLIVYDDLWFYLFYLSTTFTKVYCYNSQIEHRFFGGYNVEHRASIKVNHLQNVSLICLTAKQGGTLWMADFCMLSTQSKVPCSLTNIVIDDYN